MNTWFPDITGAILAGGDNSRMGFHKAFMNIGSERVIDRTLEMFAQLFDEILIVTNCRADFKKFKSVRVVEDIIKGCGPLGGIYTGLRASSKEMVFFVACDMPFLHIDVISHLLTIARAGGHECVVPRTERGIEPLHAVYAKTVLDRIKALIGTEDRSMKQLIARCRCKYVDVKPEQQISLVNVNTPEELRGIHAHANKIKGMA